MATKVQTGKVYHCQSPAIGSGIIQVIGGSVTLKGSNVTEYDENKKLIVPAFTDLMDTGDELDEGIHTLAGLCEWIGFEGSADEIWVKMGIDSRITTPDAE